jgi:hypothetical protein
MRDYIEPVIKNAMYDRAKGICECDDPSCSHPPGQCGKPLVAGSGVILSEGTPPDQQFDKGHYGCPDCYRRTDSFFRIAKP